MIWANLDAGHWRAARHVETVPMVLVVLVGAAILGLAGRALETKLLQGPAEPVAQPPSVGLGSSERPAWFGNAHNHVLTTALVALSIVFWFRGGGGAGIYVWTALPLLAALLFSSVNVTVTEAKVEIGLGPLRWPKKQVWIEDVAHATAGHIQPLRHGGWGYRICGPGCRAIIVREGDGMKLALNSGKTIIVTVDDASVAAGVINDLKSRGSDPER